MDQEDNINVIFNWITNESLKCYHDEHCSEMISNTKLLERLFSIGNFIKKVNGEEFQIIYTPINCSIVVCKYDPEETNNILAKLVVCYGQEVGNTICYFELPFDLLLN